MHNVWTIAKREYNQYFASPIAYVFAFFFFLGLGIYFYLLLRYATSLPGMQQSFVPSVDIIFLPIAWILILLIPALTTRLLAEERRLGTIELLMTAPVRDWELVVGKWLGAFLMLLTLLAITLVYPLILDQIVSPGIDQGPLMTGYLGLILICAATVAVGVFISSLFSNQIAAFATTMGLMIFLLLFVGVISQVVRMTGGSSDLVSYFDYMSHFTETLRIGVLDLQDIIYYLSVTALALFMSTMSLEIRRWG
jgi:ABC-2 type transport system permease protein